MALSHKFRPNPRRSVPPARQTVLVTGAAGHIGSDFCQRVRSRYDLRLLDHDGKTADRGTLGDCIDCDLSDARELPGYAPEDDFTHLRPELDRLDLEPHGTTNPLT